MVPRLALLGALLGALQSQMPLHITVPQKMLSSTTEEKDTLSYVLAVEGKPYTMRLQQQFFLPGDFRIYTYNKNGSLLSDLPYVQSNCYYRGDIEGVPGSAVTLSACAGLRGLLQFPDASYGIEPLGSSPTSQHVVYPMGSRGALGPLLTHSHPESGRDVLVPGGGFYEAHALLEMLSKHRREMALHVIVEKNLYRYLGSDRRSMTEKIIQVIGFINSMFSAVNMSVTMSSMEVWKRRNKILTVGSGEDVLLRLLAWKKTSIVLRPHEVPYLLLYQDQASYVGAVSPGMACHRDAAGGVAVLQHAVTLESFSVLLAQLLGRSLGMGFDDSRGCHCPTHVCVMNSAALRVSGAKAFSSCSAADLEQFLQQNVECSSLRALQMHPGPKAAVCGNGVVERGEQCDCGSAEMCARDKCCTMLCMLKPGLKCSLGPCCENCQFRAANSLCRPRADAQCDLPEFCSGTSASCPADLHVQDGHSCNHDTGYCYRGRCQSADLECHKLYGRGSKNAPLACYEEVNSQQDRFGHCGHNLEDEYQPCSWPNLGCGKLVCTYPTRAPFRKWRGAIIYAQVQEHLCVSFDPVHRPIDLDPLLVKDGTKCGPRNVCLNGTCHPHSVLNYDCHAERKCHGHGARNISAVCNNNKNCHCNPGWSPPYCRSRGSVVGGSVDSGQRLLGPGEHRPKGSSKGMVKKSLLLSLSVLIPVLICGIILAVKRQQLLGRIVKSRAETAASTAGESSGSGSGSSQRSSGSSSGAGTEPEPSAGPGPCRGGDGGQ